MLSILLSLGTSLAWAKTDFKNRAFEAISNPEPPFADVEESLRMAFDEENQEIRERAVDYFNLVAIPTTSPEIARAEELLVANADRFLPVSAYRRERLEALRRAINLLLARPRAKREAPRPMSDNQAWTEARRAVPQAERDLSWHAWELRRAYLRNLQRDVIKPSPAPKSLEAEEVIERLQNLRREHGLAGLEQFFLPSDLALCEKIEERVDEDTVEHKSLIRRGFKNFDEILGLTWSAFDSGHLKTSEGLELIVSRPTHTKRTEERTIDGRLVESVRSILLSPANLAHVGFLQHDNRLEALSQPRFYEARYHAFLDGLLHFGIEQLREAKLPPAAVLVILREFLANDLRQFKTERILQQGYKLGQVSHLVRTQDDPEYFRARDLRARQNKRPSLAKFLRRSARSPVVELFRGDLADVYKSSVEMLGRAMRLGQAKEPPRNKSLQECRRADQISLWAFEGRVGLTASRIQIDTPDATDLRGPHQPWTAPRGPEAFAITSSIAVEPTSGWLLLPRAENFALSSVRVERQDQTLREGEDYVVEVGENAEIPLVRVITPGVVHLRLGYKDKVERYSSELDLGSLDVKLLLPHLRRGKLTKLAARIEAASGSEQRLSANQLAHIVGSHSRYSYDDRLPLEPAPMARGPFAAYSGFSNPRGRACVQCDGANALFSDMLRVIFADDERVEIREVSCLIRKPFRSVLTALGHQRTQIYFSGQRVAILDATPWDLDRGDWFDEEESARSEAVLDEAESGPAPAATDSARSSRATALARIHKTRDALTRRPSVQRDVSDGDPTSVTPSAFEVLRALAGEPLAAGAKARRLRQYLERLAARDPSMPESPLEGDAVALAMLDEILADVETLSRCERGLTSTMPSETSTTTLDRNRAVEGRAL